MEVCSVVDLVVDSVVACPWDQEEVVGTMDLREISEQLIDALMVHILHLYSKKHMLLISVVMREISF